MKFNYYIALLVYCSMLFLNQNNHGMATVKSAHTEKASSHLEAARDLAINAATIADNALALANKADDEQNPIAQAALHQQAKEQAALAAQFSEQATQQAHKANATYATIDILHKVDRELSQQ